MKKLQFWSLMLGLVFGSLAFVACGDDDDDNSNSGGGASGDLATQIIGKWYLTEVSQDKVLVDIIEFKTDKTGSFAEYKAKAKNNWRVESGVENFTYTLTGKHVVMIAKGQQLKEGDNREGDIVMNSDGTATVTAKGEEGKTQTMTLRRVTNQTGESLINELLKDKQGSVNDRIVGTWKWGQPGMPEGEEEHHAEGYEFLSNGVCSYYDRFFSDSENKQPILDHEIVLQGTYTVDGTKLTITWTSGSYYDAGSGRKEMTKDDSYVDYVEIMYPADGSNVGVFFKRTNQNGGTSEDGPFFKVQ